MTTIIRILFIIIYIWSVTSCGSRQPQSLYISEELKGKAGEEIVEIDRFDLGLTPRIAIDGKQLPLRTGRKAIVNLFLAPGEHEISYRANILKKRVSYRQLRMDHMIEEKRKTTFFFKKGYIYSHHQIWKLLEPNLVRLRGMVFIRQYEDANKQED